MLDSLKLEGFLSQMFLFIFAGVISAYLPEYEMLDMIFAEKYVELNLPPKTNKQTKVNHLIGLIIRFLHQCMYSFG